MTLNISEVKNAKLKAVLNKYDNDNNKSLSTEEFAIFKEQEYGKLSDRLYNKACSLFKPEATEGAKAESQNVDTLETTGVDNTQAQSEVGTVTPQTPEVKITRNKKAEHILRIKHDLMTSHNLIQQNIITMANVAERIESRNKGDEYVGIVEDIKNIVDEINKMIVDGKNNKKERKDIVNDIRKNLRKNDNINSYTYADIITELIQIAEHDMIIEESEELQTIYVDIKKNNPDVTNIEKLIDLVKEKMDKEGLTNKSYYSGKAFKLLEQFAIELKKDEIKKANEKDTEYLDAKAKQKRDIQQYSDDKYSKKAAKQSTVDYEVRSQRNKHDQRAENISNVTRAELEEKVSKGLIEKLDRNFLGRKAGNVNKEGNYDFSKIYEATDVGGIGTWRLEKHSDKEMSEYTHFADAIATEGIHNLTKAELRELYNFVGGTAKKDHSVLTGLKNGVDAIGAGAIAGLFSGLTIDLKQTMKLKLSPTLGKELIADFEKQGFSPKDLGINSEGKMEILLDQRMLADTHVVSSIVGAVSTFALEFFTTVLFGETESERACISPTDYTINDSKYTNFEEYKTYVTKKYEDNPFKANALIAIAEQYKKEDGTIDAAGFNSYINEISGPGSLPNCIELKYGKKAVNDNTTETTTTNNTDQEKDKLNVEQVHYEKSTPTREKVEIKTENLAHSSWNKIADSYDCLDEQFGSKYNAIRVIKIAQGIENEELFTNEAVLQHLLELSLDHKWSEMKQIPGFNFDKFWGYYKGQVIGEVKLPSRLGNCTHKDIDYTDRTIADKSGRGPAGIPVETYRVGSKSEEDWGYRYKDENGVSHTVWCGTKDKQQQAINNFVAANPNLEVTVLEKVHEVKEK